MKLTAKVIEKKVVDGGKDGYCKESDVYNVGDSSLKYVKVYDNDTTEVIYDPGMMDPIRTITIKTSTNEILSNRSEMIYGTPRTKKFYVVADNYKRGTLGDVKDCSYKG